MASLLLRSAATCIRRLPKAALQQFRGTSDNFEIEYKKTETSVQMIGKEDEWLMYMESYSQVGFKLNSGVRIIGPCAVFPRSILHWNVKGPDDIDEDSLSLFTLLEPKLDILIIGKGDRSVQINPKIYTYLRSKNLNVEILPTDQALATFNFLNSEKRYVAGAFIPPEYLHTNLDADAGMAEQVERRDIYNLEMDFHEYDSKAGDELAEALEYYEKGKVKLKEKFEKTRSDSKTEYGDDPDEKRK